MQINERNIHGVFEIILKSLEDERGFFMRTYSKEIFENYGIDRNWLHENHSLSKKKGIIRGLHFQFPPYTETKLVRCIRGAIFDVFVDIRKNSQTLGQWDYIELSEDNKKMIYIPRGFAHGFCTLTDNCGVVYKVDNLYHSEAEGGIVWNDATLNIPWPVDNPILSEKDAKLRTFKEFVAGHGGLDIGNKEG
jgi:dTDP-4-dehydrorhamnose 3,5-epimerase